MLPTKMQKKKKNHPNKGVLIKQILHINKNYLSKNNNIRAVKINKNKNGVEIGFYNFNS